MEISDWISTFMALIATASAIITYVVYRTSTDPEVIVYVDTDKKRPSFVNLIIKNIGNGSAENIVFETSRPLPSKAFGIEEPKNMPSLMKSGPIVDGIPYMAPNQSMVITWGQYGGLKKYIGKKSIVVTAKYKRANSKLSFSKNTSSSQLFIEAFGETDISDFNWDKQLVEELKNTNKQLHKIEGKLSVTSTSES
ncbi:hypothetical protein [Vibrio parahaemolyticus]|uniref:hypothetical protein n=1 Tax=Vibrio parahaemolyticus TaxID=670 RepID=UPI001123B20B|nr:hypothetical protein [Vibrio parahaemolyticus]MBE5160330.1 hypothetical protein [Vibrio parahaemolyticus]TOB53882.1 hypothetical protein CGK03_22745 [Vibrio parahaemolyticus]